MTGHDGEFHLRSCSKVVDHNGDTLLIAERPMLQNFRQKRLGQFVGMLAAAPHLSGFSMDTEAKLHLIFAEVKAGP